MVNWGIIGLGRMGSTFYNALKEISNAKLVLTASQSNKNVGQIDTVTYEDLIQNKNIDAIYISTLNNTHTDLIIKSIKNSKNVLCEKPLSMNLNEAIKIENILNDVNVNFFEAIAYYSHPQTLKLLEVINNKEIGDIIQIDSSFGYKSKENIKKRIYNKEFGGGAILDLACYPISFAMLFCKSKKS